MLVVGCWLLERGVGLNRTPLYHKPLTNHHKPIMLNSNDVEADGLFVSEIRAQFIDENDLQRVVIKRIWEEYDAELRQWHLKRVEYIFEDPDYPVPSEPLNIAVESRHGWLIPPEWEFEMEVWVYTRQPTDRPPKGHTYDHEGLVGIIR